MNLYISNAPLSSTNLEPLFVVSLGMHGSHSSNPLPPTPPPSFFFLNEGGKF